MLDFGRTASFRVGNVYCKYQLLDADRPVVVSFAHHISGVEEDKIEQSPDPWAFQYLSARSPNVVCFSFISGKYTYYRDRNLLDALPGISSSLRLFPQRLGYGCSAGAYAVSAFSNVLRLDKILLLCPISTRLREVATWDLEAKRFLSSFDFDWEEPYADGAATESEGYVIYDPLFRLDRLHAERYTKLKKLVLPGTGHLVPDRLHRLGMLSWTVDSFLTGEIPESEFYTRARGRKELRDYYAWMLSRENVRLTKTREKAILRALADRNSGIYYGLKLPAFAHNLRKGYEPADLLRDLALTFEEGGDKQTALALMAQAYNLRPGGMFIQSKYKSLKGELQKAEAQAADEAPLRRSMISEGVSRVLSFRPRRAGARIG